MTQEHAPGTTVIRTVALDDMETLVALCSEHARFERAGYTVEGKASALASALVASRNVFAWIAERDGEPVGYTVATTDFSTWLAREYTHMDCLFVREGHRGSEIGRRLLATVRQHARDRGHVEVQWQTPAWNARAANFYRREGATDALKLRFSMPA
jgi:GNAT superfamily N-acetyltransferase